MTRDQWLQRCAQRFIDRSSLDQGEAAAYAKECASAQQDLHGKSPGDWDQPADAADEEMSYWDHDVDEGA